MRLYTQDFQSFPQSNEFVERASRTLRKPKKRKLRKCREDDTDPYLAMLAIRTTKNSSGTSSSESLMKKTLRTLLPSLKVNVNTKAKLKKPIVSQSREFQPMNTIDRSVITRITNWARTGIILNKNDVLQSYTLLNVVIYVGQCSTKK